MHESYVVSTTAAGMFLDIKQHLAGERVLLGLTHEIALITKELGSTESVFLYNVNLNILK